MWIPTMLLTAVTFGTLCGCTALQQHAPAEEAEVKKNVAKEIDRICTLPQPQRDAELRKLKNKTGLDLYCSH